MPGRHTIQSETMQALEVGAVLGDSDAASMAWSAAIGALSRTVARLADDIETPIRVNVVYHVDGKIAPNEFEGVRTGRFDRAKSLLIVQAAVPAQVPSEPERLLLGLLAAAVTAAEAFVQHNKLAESLDGLRGLVERVAAGQSVPE